MKTKCQSAGYDRNAVTPGILHIGVGNFHRAHEEFYTNELLGKDASQSHWGIVGAMLMPQDEKLFRELEHQEGRYTVTVCGRDGKDSCHEIDSLKEVICELFMHYYALRGCKVTDPEAPQNVHLAPVDPG